VNAGDFLISKMNHNLGATPEKRIADWPQNSGIQKKDSSNMGAFLISN